MNDLEIYLRVGTIVAQVFIGIAVIFSARSIARAQYSKSIQDAWQDYNKMVLSNIENLRLDKENWSDGSAVPDNEIRKRYMQIMLLNIHEAQFIGLKHGLYRRSDDGEAQTDLLKPLLEKPGVFDISQKRGFSSCSKLNVKN